MRADPAEVIRQQEHRGLSAAGHQRSGMAMVEAVAGRQDQHGAPIDFKAASALGTVLRASESRRWLYGFDTPTKVTASFAAQMTEEEALAILADYDNPFPD